MTPITRDDEEILEEFEDEEEDLVLGSYIVAEIGSANTEATLYDIYDGSYQLVARGTSLTTSGPPWHDTSHGLHAAIQQVSDLIGRPLINDSNVLLRPVRRDGSGFDYLGTIISAAEPMRTIVVGLMDEVSVASIRRALSTIYSTEIDCFSLSDQRSRHEQLEALVNKSPDLVFIAGGTNGGATRQLTALIETVAMGIRLIEADSRPIVVFAGNEAIQKEVEQVFAEETEIYVIDNVRPDLESENLDQAIGILGDLYVTSQCRKLANGELIVQRNDLPVLPVVHGYGAFCEFVSALNGGRVIGIDLGRRSLSVVSADNDYVNLDVSSDLGLGEHNSRLTTISKIEDIAAWAGVENKNGKVGDYIANKAVWPNMVPLTTEEMRIEQSIAWAYISYAIKRAYQRWNWTEEQALAPVRTLLLRGAVLVNSVDWKRLMILILDALQPVGIFNVIVDRPEILPSLGLLAAYNPYLVVQLYESIAEDKLGWVIAPNSSAHEGQLVLKLQIEIDNEDKRELEILKGDFKVVPLPSDKKAKVIVAPARDTDVGIGPGKSRSFSISGGPVGIMIDARGRPLTKATDPQDQLRLIRKWLHEIEK